MNAPLLEHLEQRLGPRLVHSVRTEEVHEMFGVTGLGFRWPLVEALYAVLNLGLRNVAIISGEPHDPKLPAGSADVAILVHMYHEISQPYGLMYNLVPALNGDARVGIVDAYAPTSEHGTPPDLLRCELAAVGYRAISIDRLTGSNAYLAIFAPPSMTSRTRPEAIVACKGH